MREEIALAKEFDDYCIDGFKTMIHDLLEALTKSKFPRSNGTKGR